MATTILFGCAYVLSLIDRQILSLMIGPGRADLHLDDVRLAILNGFAFVLLYSVLGLEISMVAGRFCGRRSSLAVWSCGASP